MPTKNNKKKKKTTEDYLTDVVLDHSAKIEELINIINEMVKNTPDFAGGSLVEVFLDGGTTNRYYMVSDMFVNDPFVEFFHLVSADPDHNNLSLESFPVKAPKQTMRAFIKMLGKEKRWNRMHEQINLQTVTRIQTVGFHTYSKSLLNEENNINTPRNKGHVIPLSKHKK